MKNECLMGIDLQFKKKNTSRVDIFFQELFYQTKNYTITQDNHCHLNK